MNRNKSTSLRPMIVVMWLFAILAVILLAPGMLGAQSGSTIRIDPDSRSLNVNDTYSFSILIDVESGRNYGNGSFTISYDPAVLRIDSFSVGSGLFGASNTSQPGTIRFNALSITGVQGSVTLGTGQFTAIGGGDASLAITIVDPPGDAAGVGLTNVQTINPVIVVAGNPTPTNTPNATAVPPTSTPTNVPPTNTPTNTPVAPTATATATDVPPTNTPTNTPVVPTATATATDVPPTNTPTNTPVVPTATATATDVPPTNTPTNTPVVPTATATATDVPPTNTPTNTPVVPTATATATDVPPTNTPTHTPVVPTATATATDVPPTSTPTNTPVVLTATSTPTNVPPIPTATNTPTGTPTMVSPTATSTPTSTPSISSCGPLMQEAENGTLSGRFVVGNRSDASDGQYVHVPDRTGNLRVSLANNNDFVTFCFDVPADGQYKIQGWVSFEGTRHLSDSFFVQVNGSPSNGYLWDTAKNTGFTADNVNDRGKQDPVVVNLTAGEHIVIFHLREDGTLLDKVALVASGPPVDPTPTSTPAPTMTPQPTVTATPTIAPTATPDPIACGPLTQEAEDGELSGRFVVGNRSDASGGQFVHVPDKTGNLRVSLAKNDDYVRFCFDVPADGNYQILARSSHAGTRHLSDSFFVQVDGGPNTGYLWDTPAVRGFTLDSVSDRNKQDPVIIYLTAGEHTVTFHLREDGTLLDKLSLVLID